MDLRSLAFDSTTHQAVLSHLRAAPERVAFMSTTAETAEVVDWVPMTDRDVIVGPSCAELTDEATARFFTWAAKGEGAIIEAHSHLGRWGDPARFSDLDLDALQEWVPHVRWRLVGGPTSRSSWGRPPSMACTGTTGGLRKRCQLESLVVLGQSLSVSTALSMPRGGPSSD